MIVINSRSVKKCGYIISTVWITLFFTHNNFVIGQNRVFSDVDNFLNTAAIHAKQGNLDSTLYYQLKALSYPHSLREEGIIRLALSSTLFKKSNFEGMLFHSQRALTIGEKLQDKHLLSSAYNELGLYYLDKSQSEQALRHFEQALAYSEKPALKADIFNNLAYLSGQSNKNVDAIDYYFKALSLYQANNLPENQGKTLSNIASVYHAMGRLNEAIKFINQSISIREQLQDIVGLSTAYGNAAQMYILKKDYTTASRYMDLARAYAEKLGNPRQIAASYQGIATLKRRLGEKDEAWVWQQKAIRLFEEQQQTEILSRVYIAAASLAGERKDTTSADELFSKAIFLAQKINSYQNLSMVYSQMTAYYKQRNNFEKAFHSYQQFVAYKDSIQNKEVVTKIAEIEQRYLTAKKDQEITKLREEQLRKELEIARQEQSIFNLTQSEKYQAIEIQQQKEELLRVEAQNQLMEQKHKLVVQQNIIHEQELRQERMWKIIFSLGLLMLLWITYNYFRRYRLKKELEHQQSLLLERNRIAQDLHDEVGSTLSAINILSHAAKDRFTKQPEKVGKQLETISDNAQAMLETMNDIVWSIHPQNDELEKMLLRMREYASTVLEPREIDYTFELSEEAKQMKLPPVKRRNLYLTFKEAINNVAKYSQATQVTIELFVKNRHLHMRIKDNGKGFDLQKQYEGNGVKNMKKRAADSEGMLIMQSILEQGTSIELRIPYA